MTSGSFTATYQGRCPTCEGPILGHLVAYGPEGLAHVTCPDPLPAAARPVCHRCFMEKSVTGACGCDL